MTAEQYAKIASGLLRFTRKFVPYGSEILRAVKANSTLANLENMNTGVMQSMRRVAVQMSKRHWVPEACAMAAFDLCTQLRQHMGSHLELDPHELHCCWKALANTGNPDNPAIHTWARSKPLDHRPERTQNILTCTSSTVYASLTAGNDGEIQWPRMPCFSSQNLPQYLSNYKNNRDQWAKFYKSTLVFPLRYVRNPDNDDADLIGFIAFDSPKIGAFGDSPEIFKYRDEPAEYHKRLHASSAFHLGSILADSLSAHLHGVYNVEGAKGTENAEKKAIQRPNLAIEGPNSPNQPRRRGD